MAPAEDITGAVTANDSASKPLSGYDLPVYGVDNGQFYVIHISALVCIFFSLSCVITTIVWSFRQNKDPFHKWSTGNRMVIYLALCDGFFNLFHSMDHLHYAIVYNHVSPPALCAFYGFSLIIFTSAQNIMVLLIAVSACTIVYRQRPLNFGRRDWRLLLCTFGTPLVTASVVAGLGGLGPHGAFCCFDGVRGRVINIFFTSVPFIALFIVNSVLYFLTCLKIHMEAKRNARVLGSSRLTSASVNAAKTCLMFVAGFFIQWWAMGSYGTWQLMEAPPHLLFQFVVIFSNIGGILNFIIFLRIRRRNKQSAKSPPASDTPLTPVGGTS